MDNLTLSCQRAVKLKIEKMKCPEHGEYPKITFTSKGFSISCCCDKFCQLAIKESEKLIGKAVEDEITKVFKG